MSTYKLPRTESGDVNLYKVIGDILRCSPSEGQIAILEALISNARKEEREACARIADNTAHMHCSEYREEFVNAIRNREDGK
jgi:hypothetical protein